jgi:hypothetical protein
MSRTVGRAASALRPMATILPLAAACGGAVMAGGGDASTDFGAPPGPYDAAAALEAASHMGGSSSGPIGVGLSSGLSNPSSGSNIGVSFCPSSCQVDTECAFLPAPARKLKELLRHGHMRHDDDMPGNSRFRRRRAAGLARWRCARRRRMRVPTALGFVRRSRGVPMLRSWRMCVDGQWALCAFPTPDYLSAAPNRVLPCSRASSTRECFAAPYALHAWSRPIE